MGCYVAVILAYRLPFSIRFQNTCSDVTYSDTGIGSDEVLLGWMCIQIWSPRTGISQSITMSPICQSLTILVFGDVTLQNWQNVPNTSNKFTTFILRGWEGHGKISSWIWWTLTIKEVYSLKRNIYPVTQHNIPEDWNPRLHCCNNCTFDY